MNAGIIAMVLVFSIMMANMNSVIGKREQQVRFDGAQTTFTQLALAQYRRSTDFKDAARPALGLRGYADTPALLHEDTDYDNKSYLPVWVDHYEYWKFYTTGGTGFKITFEAGNAYAAQQIARRMGNIATVAGDIVSVGFSSAAELALLDTFVRKQGDSMQGGLSFDAGVGGLVMNGNPIQNSGKVSFNGANGSIGDAINMKGNDIADARLVTSVSFKGANGDIDTFYSKNISQVQTLNVLDGVGRIESKSVVTDTILTNGITYID